MFSREPIGTTNGGIAGFGLLIAQYSTFSAKINDLWPIRGAARRFSAVSPGLGLRSTSGEDRKRRQIFGQNLSAKSVTGTWSRRDRKSTRLNSSHSQISYAVFCLKKKKKYCNPRPYNIQTHKK